MKPLSKPSKEQRQAHQENNEPIEKIINNIMGLDQETLELRAGKNQFDAFESDTHQFKSINLDSATGQQITEMNKTFNATEKLIAEYDELMLGNGNQVEKQRTDVKQLKQQYESCTTEENLEDPLEIENRSDTDIEAIQNSWRQLKQEISLDVICSQVFELLFAMEPKCLELEPFNEITDRLYSEKSHEFSAFVINTVDQAVLSLQDLDQVQESLQAAGLKLAQIGFKPSYFQSLGQALVGTLNAALGDRFTADLETQWDWVLKQIFEIMMDEFHSNPDALIDCLTPAKVESAIRVWNRLINQGKLRVSRLIFETFLEENPNMKELFSFSKQPNAYDSSEFENHLMSVMGEIGKAIVNYNKTDVKYFANLRKLGLMHLEKGVKKEYYDILGRVIILCIKNTLTTTYYERQAILLMFATVKDAIISSNYENEQKYMEIYNGIGISKQEIAEAEDLWRRQIYRRRDEFGFIYFRTLFKIYPEIISRFETLQRASEKTLVEASNIFGKEIIQGCQSFMVCLEDPFLVYQVAKQMRDKVLKFNFTPYMYYIMKENLLLVLEELLGSEMPNPTKWSVTKTFKLIRNMIHQEDFDLRVTIIDSLDNNATLSEEEIRQARDFDIEKKRTVEQSWRKVSRYPREVAGPLLYKNIFTLHPEALPLFSFKDQKNFLESGGLKRASASAIGSVNTVVTNLDNFEAAAALLMALGSDHDIRDVTRKHYHIVRDALLKTVSEVDGPHCDIVVKSAWLPLYAIMAEKMIMKEKYNEYEDLKYLKQQQRFQAMRLFQMNIITRINKSDATLNLQTPFDFQSMNLREQRSESRKIFAQKFQDDVDFHHHIAYLFEKSYRLGRKVQLKERMNLDLEIIYTMSEYNWYIQSDQTSLFYALFYCIYFKNTEVMAFIRSLIKTSQRQTKIDRLLEIIDTHGIDKIRTVGEQINNIVYHMVFYQAIEDRLRIVYSAIFKQMRFVQLRDTDAVYLLNSRDYEIIKLSFEKFSTKVSIDPNDSNQGNMMCHNYRRYNQAYFEEILINFGLEERVTHNYRERFLVTAEDKFITFEMYCREDYDEEFIRTSKGALSEKQFVDLFVICIKNDSFKIGMLIYLLYLDKDQVMDSKMMEIILQTVKWSTRFHEIKLFFVHQHFEVLTIQQLDQLISSYQHLLIDTSELSQNPMVSQFNTIKVALLIYRICWRIELQEIYSLITKCKILEEHLIQALFRYFERQQNIIALKKFMMEPILEMGNSSTDSLDIMLEMNVQKLLQHPIIVEVLNLINEGRFSVTTSQFSISETFSALADMETFSLRSVTARMLSNVKSMGMNSFTKQSSLQFNIWKHSMEQRQNDEMLFTSTLSICFMLVTLILNIEFQHSYIYEIEAFGDSLFKYPELVTQASNQTKQQFCEQVLTHKLEIIEVFIFLMSVFVLASVASIIQKVIIYRTRNSPDLKLPITLIQVLIAFIGFLTIQLYNSDDYLTLLSDLCSGLVPLSPQEYDHFDRLQTFINSSKIEGKYKIKYLMSALICFVMVILLDIMSQAKYLGDYILMLFTLTSEVGKFFYAFGLHIGIFVCFGRILFDAIMFHGTTEPDKYWHITLDLFTTMNGKPDFSNFRKPFGQTFLFTFLVAFKILLFSVMTVMIIQRHKQQFQNLESHKRMIIIKNKKTASYDNQLGGVMLSFFPLNIFVLPFMIPIYFLHSKRISDFALKLQYSVMMAIYAAIQVLALLFLSPLLFLKMIANSIFILAKNQRVSYKGENVVQLLIAVSLSPCIILASILVDLISLPNVLFVDHSKLELKYQSSDTPLTDSQMLATTLRFSILFFSREGWKKLKNRQHTLRDLMNIHLRIFNVVQNLHDLTCRGVMDYKQSLSTVQDYNLMKILSQKSSFPDQKGDHKMSVVDYNVLRNLLEDLEYFNQIDLVLRKHRMGMLSTEVSQVERNIADIWRPKYHEPVDGEEDEELLKVEGVKPIQIGPDGNPLKRNNSDLISFIHINAVVRSFTTCEENLNSNMIQQRRAEISEQQQLLKTKNQWREKVMEQFLASHRQFTQIINQNQPKEPSIHPNKPSTVSTTETKL